MPLMHPGVRKRRVFCSWVRACMCEKSITITLASGEALRYITFGIAITQREWNSRSVIVDDYCNSGWYGSHQRSMFILRRPIAETVKRSHYKRGLLKIMTSVATINLSIRRNKILTKALRSPVHALTSECNQSCAGGVTIKQARRSALRELLTIFSVTVTVLILCINNNGLFSPSNR